MSAAEYAELVEEVLVATAEVRVVAWRRWVWREEMGLVTA